MKRPALDYAALPDVPVSQMTPAEQLIAKVAWISDNAAYGTLEAAKLLIDDIRAGSFTGATPRPSARPEVAQHPWCSMCEQIAPSVDGCKAQVCGVRDAPLPAKAQEGHTIAFPVEVSHEPEDDPEFSLIRDATGRALDPEEIVLALNTFAPSPQRLFTATDVEQQLQDGLKRIADKKE